MAATTISRTNIGTNDDGSGTTGTVINTSYIGLAIYDAVDALFSASGGITLNQAGGDGAILSLESSDVAHGVTGYAGTDTYAFLVKQSATSGGVRFVGLSETTGGIFLEGVYTTDDTTKSNAAVASVFMSASKKSGTSVTVPGANANLAVISKATVGAMFIFDAEGESHQDVGTTWTAFDTHDDVALIASLETEILAGRDELKDTFRDWMVYNREALEQSRLVTFNENGRHFVNFTRLSMALCGAVRQLAVKNQLQEQRLLAIEGR
jgi:hypothetical protein